MSAQLHVRGRGLFARVPRCAPPSVRPVPDGLLVEADLVAALPRDLVGELRRQMNALL